MFVDVKCHYPTGTIVLKRPDSRNALTRALMLELKQAFEDLHMERRVRAVILTGAGSAFCAGMDLAEMRETSQEENALELWHQDAVQYQELLELMLRFPKPIIAAVNGPAVAGGAGLVLASDIVLAAPEARFGLPEPKRGLVAGLVSPLLAFRVGGGQAARLLLTTELITAEEALRIGLYHQLGDAETLWPQAQKLVEQIAESAPEALRLTKQMLNENIGEHLFVSLTGGAAASATARTTEAAQEGLAAFLEKRAPVWP